MQRGKKLILLSYLSYLFRLQLLSEDCYLLEVEGLQSAERTKTTQKQIYKCTHFYRKQKPLSC